MLASGLPIIMAIYMRISGEETMLIERFGDEYSEYMKRTPRLIPSLIQKYPRGWDDQQVNIDVFRNPSKHLKRLPLEKIVADTRVYREGVDRYKEKIAKGDSVPPIIVVKHPTKEVYAVLDGHHRYYAYVELGREEIDCALAGNVSAVVFHMTEHGVFQPPSGLTEHIRVPAFEFNAKVKQFLSDFSKDPDKTQKSVDDHIRPSTHP
ncbi:MAG TPA: ParB N-terminal domain-containing protein [Terriglobales bacterium]|nr:ParB N-terminal domain-containing protein [Terriglobales bacterium]